MCLIWYLFILRPAARRSHSPRCTTQDKFSLADKTYILFSSLLTHIYLSFHRSTAVCASPNATHITYIFYTMARAMVFYPSCWGRQVWNANSYRKFLGNVLINFYSLSLSFVVRLEFSVFQTHEEFYQCHIDSPGKKCDSQERRGVLLRCRCGNFDTTIRVNWKLINASSAIWSWSSGC